MDLFEKYDELPKKVKAIFETYSEEGDLYKENERLLKLLKPLGYTFDYGLCGTAYDLAKI